MRKRYHEQVIREMANRHAVRLANETHWRDQMIAEQAGVIADLRAELIHYGQAYRAACDELGWALVGQHPDQLRAKETRSAKRQAGRSPATAGEGR